jgi:hypothetical protein
MGGADTEVRIGYLCHERVAAIGLHFCGSSEPERVGNVPAATHTPLSLTKRRHQED